MPLSAFTPEMARLRAEICRRVRAFFAERSVLEVHTPIASRGISTDCHIDVFSTAFHSDGVTAGPASVTLYLQTSPELHMKRLLANGFPDIFQISRVFRNGEAGRIHNPEFSLLEWYRRGFDMHRLADETVELCQALLGARPVVKKSYRDAVRQATGLDPLQTPLRDLVDFCRSRSPAPPELPTVTDALQFIMAAHVEPGFPRDALMIVHGFPAEQAVLAVLDEQDPRVARRFEAYGGGCELANGYEELADWQENRRRMEEDGRKRAALGKPVLPVDRRFVEALKAGLPRCSGVAVGLDRVIMLAAGADSVGAVTAFPWPES